MSLAIVLKSGCPPAIDNFFLLKTLLLLPPLKVGRHARSENHLFVSVNYVSIKQFSVKKQKNRATLLKGSSAVI
jgi:hypothetical protein